MKLVIKRNKWVNGSNCASDGKFGLSRLLNGNGNMCCIGFFARECGFAPRTIKHIDTPGRLHRSFEIRNATKLKKKLKESRFGKLVNFKQNNKETVLTRKLIRINDASSLSNEIREQKIKEQFKTIGVDVVFKDK